VPVLVLLYGTYEVELIVLVSGEISSCYADNMEILDLIISSAVSVLPSCFCDVHFCVIVDLSEGLDFCMNSNFCEIGSDFFYS
jgi:hypothetical protein